GAAAAWSAGHVDGGARDSRHGVCDRDGNADERHRRQIADVVADVAGVRGGNAVTREDTLHHRRLVGRVLMHLGDAQLTRPALHDVGATTRDEGGDDTGVSQQHQPLAVTHVETLELIAPFGVPDAAVGEHTVDVHRDEPHRCPPCRRPSPRHAPSARSRSMTNGSAITARVTSSTSVSPKLYSKRPATRNAATAASAPITGARSAVADAGTRRRMWPVFTKNSTKIQSQSTRPTRPRSTAICSGVLWRWLVWRRKASGGA